MRRAYRITILTILLLPVALFAADFKTLMHEADACAGTHTLSGYTRSVPLYEEALSQKPDSFDANWKLARSCAWQANLMRRIKADGWQEKSIAAGQRGMAAAECAQHLAADQPEGFYWYVRNIRAYAEGVSIITALQEGLLPNTKAAIHQAYELDRTYYDWSPTFMIASFYDNLPWPLRDRRKALAYYREFEHNAGNTVECDERACYSAHLLLDQKDKQCHEEARILLEHTMATGDPYFQEWARRMYQENADSFCSRP